MQGQRESQVALARYIVAEHRRRPLARQRLTPSGGRLSVIASRPPQTESAEHSAPDEIHVGRYPGAVRLLIAVGLSIVLWGLVLFAASAIISLFHQR
jgi:hypothetical protein